SFPTRRSSDLLGQLDVACLGSANPITRRRIPGRRANLEQRHTRNSRHTLLIETDSLREVLQIRRRELAELRVLVLCGRHCRKVRLPHRDRLTVSTHEIALRQTSNPPRRDSVRLARDLKVSQRAGSSISQTDNVRHLRRASEISRATAINEHDNRDPPQTMLIPAGLHP